MTLNYNSSRSSKVKGHGANLKPIGGFLYDFHVSNIVSLTAFEVLYVNVL